MSSSATASASAGPSGPASASAAASASASSSASSASSSAASSDDEAVRRLGARIRELRTARGLTLVQLAAATDLSHPFISQLERGLAQPSLATLRRMAVALETSPLELIAASEPPVVTPAIEVLRAGELDVVPDGYGAGEARLLTHGAQGFLPMSVHADALEPGERFVHDEEEFLHVVEGALRIELGPAGEAVLHELAAGDSIYYPGGVPHRWWSGDGRPYRLVVVKSAGRR